MKRQFTLKRFKNRLAFMFVALISAFMLSNAYGQTITIDSEPTGPLYVGDTIEVEYTATSFDASAEFFLVIEDPNPFNDKDSILAQSSATNTIFEVEIPAGFPTSSDLIVYGVVGDPNGPEAYLPVFGELTIAGASSAYDDFVYNDYNDRSDYLDFDDPGVRRVQLPEMDLDVDSARLVFDYRYWGWPDTLELVIQYSTDGGTSYTNLDTVSYINTSWQTYEMGLPAAALTTSTALRVKQLYANLNNYENAYEVRIGNIKVQYGSFPEITTEPLAGSPFTLALPSTNITLINGPVDAPVSFRSYAGDSIHIEATTSNFTADTEFEIVFNNTGNLDDPVHHLREITVVSSTESSPGVFDWVFEAKLPTNMPYNNWQYFWVVPYKGTYEHGATISHDFSVSGASGHNILGESSIDGTYGIYFTAENVRSVETAEMDIASEGMLYIELARRDNIMSPENTDIIAEYSLDGGSTYTEIGSIPLNQANVYTSGTTMFEMAIPAGAVSKSTTFRFRQKNINSGNLDQFYLTSYDIMLNSNRFVDNYSADINLSSEYIYDPEITFEQMDLPEDLIYPGTALDLDYTVTAGEFPANTMIWAKMTNHNPDLVLTETTVQETGTIPVNIPAIYGGVYNLSLNVSTPHGTVNSSSRSITVEEVNMEVLSATGDPVRSYSNGDTYYLPGDQLTVEYNLVGQATHGVELQIEDNSGDWNSLIIDDPADGQIVTAIPTDITLPTDPDIRLVLTDTLYSTSTTQKYYTKGEPDFPNKEIDSMIMSAEGVVDPNKFNSYISYATFGTSGTRSFETKPFKIVNHGTFRYLIIVPDNYNSYNWESKVDSKISPIHIQYSTDGVTWTNIDEFDPLDIENINTPPWITDWDYIDVTLDLPYEAISEQTQFRIIQNEDGALGFGENVWTFYLMQVRDGNPVILTSDNTMTLTIEQASISLGSLAKSTYGPGEAITIPYNVVGEFPGDVGFVSYLQNDAGEKFIIDTDEATGLVQLAANMPVNIPETAENGDEYDLYVWPYEKETPETMPLFSYMEDFDDNASDVIALEGGYYTGSYYNMYHSGPRSVLTKALTQLDGDSVYFDFYMYVADNPLPGEGVFVEVTYDGGATFNKLDTITATDNYTIALASADMTDQTHLRWIQYWDNNAYDYDWDLQNMLYRTDESNIIASGWVDNNQPITNIEIDYPDFPSEFNVGNLQEDIVYSGGTFDMEVTLDEGYSPLPATTEYMFYLADQSNNVMYDQDGNMILLGSMTGTGTTSLTVPSSVHNDQYRIVTTIQVDDPDSDDPYVYYEEEYTAGLDVYNPQLKTIVATDEVYRGDEITVGWELLSGSINTADYYFHLVVDNETLYTQKDAPVNFVENLPTDFSTGNREVKIFATTDSVYKKGGNVALDVYSENEWATQENMYIWNGNYLRFNQTGARNRVTSALFDMTQGGKVTFDFNYSLNGGNEFLESNKVIFEYSDDGGETYNELDTYPNENYELNDGYVTQTFYFAKGMLSDSTKFRFRRQNGNYGNAFVQNFWLTQWSNEAPLEYVADQISVLTQEVELGSLPISVCPGTSFSLDYNIDGKFGEKVVHSLQYSRNNSGYSTFPDLEISGVTEGSGSFEVTIPSDWSAGDYRFRMHTYDATENTTINITGPQTDNELYFVPTINFTGTYLPSDKNLCEEGISTYNIYNTQAYFMYQARDVETGELYGEPVYNESGGTQSLQTETITEDIELEIFVTAMTPDMQTTCATGVIDDRIELTLSPEQKLYRVDGSIQVAATAMEICENDNSMFIQPGYFEDDGSYVSNVSSITWYRDDKTTAVSSNTSLNNFNQSGGYFAELISNGCEYTTDTVQITVLNKPDQPTVTATGDLTFCEGSGSVELTADMEYPYYRWYGGSGGNDQMSGSSQSLEAVTDGSYRLQVSNYPFEMGCASPKSEPVKVNVIEEPNTYIYRSSGGTWIDDNSYASCGDDVYLRVASYPQTFSWTLNGEAFSSSSNINTLKATQTGWYNVRSIGQQNGVTCTFDTPDSIFIQLSDEVPTPSITHTGDDVFCAGEGSAEITAPEGYAGYRWERYGSSITSQDVIIENRLLVEETGDYTVSVIDEFGCESDESEDTEITVIPLPYRYSNVNASNDEVCGPSVAEVRVTSLYGNNRVLMYQLVDINTGELSGDPSSKVNTDGSSDYVTLFSDTIYSDTEFGVMVYDQNASGCDVMLQNTDVVYVNTAEITVDGNTLTASTGGSSYQWYRDGVAVPGNRGTLRSIEVYDNATYTVDVEFDMACTMTSEGVSIPGSDVPLPSFYSNVDVVDNTLCGASSAEVRVSNLSQYNRTLTYQLINMGTGESSGSPITFTATSSSDFVLLESAEVSEETEFGVMVYDPSISGNETMLEETVTVDANIAEIAIIGNQLIATPGADSYQWYRNGEPIMGDRGKSSMIEVFDDAAYTVTIVFGFDCILTSTDAAEVKNVTGISNVLAEDNVLLYPNPTKDKVNIEFFNNYAGDITVEVTNLAGQVVHNEMISKNNQFMNMTIDMNEFQQGVYYINFITDDHSLVKRIVKQ